MNPNNSGNENSSDGKPVEKGSSNSQNASARPGNIFKKPKVVIAIFAIIEIFSLILWQFSNFFHGYLAMSFHWLSVCGFLSGAALIVMKIFHHPKTVWCIFCIICLALGGFLIWNGDLKPHLNLVLNAQNSFEDGLELIGDVVLARNDEFISETNTFGLVIVPVSPAHSNAVLRLSLTNNSPSPAEAAELVILIPAEMKCFPTEGSQWQLSPRSGWPGMQAFEIRASSPILPGDVQILPDLILTDIGGWTNNPAMAVAIIKAKDMAQIRVKFRILFLYQQTFQSPD